MGIHIEDPWYASITADDMRLHGYTVLDGETPVQALMREAEDMDVDLAAVGRCLQLLANERCILVGGSPVGMLAACPRRGVFFASADGEPQADLPDLSPASAGLWLTLLASEAGDLPQTCAEENHWLLVRLTPRVSAMNADVVALAESYARMAVHGDVPAELGTYERALGQAFWRCAAQRLR